MRRAARRALEWLSPFSPLAALGCGGGAVLLHPAHTLGEGRVTVGAGVSGQFVFGEAEDAIDTGRSVSAPGVSAGTNGEQSYLDGAVAEAMITPGIAPWVSARVGFGGKNEAGATYAGRSLRI